MQSSDKRDEAKPQMNVDGAYRGGLGIRHLQIAVMSAAAFIAYSLRANLSVAIVGMVDVRNDTNTNSSTPTFDWDEKTQGYVLSSFFWGYVATQIPAGMLTSRFSSHRFLYTGILTSSALSLVLPQCAFYGGWILVCVNRALQGMSQGFVFPSIYALLGVWAPPDERSRLASIAIGSNLLGTILCTPVAGFLSSSYGWPSVFYVCGSMGVAFGVAMTLLGADNPSAHRMISCAEKTYIQSSLGGPKEKRQVPWKKVLISVPFLSTVFVDVCQDAVMVTFHTKIPTFLGTTLKINITDVGFLTALPYLTSWILTFLWSWICDLLISRSWLKVTTARKLFNSIALFVGAVFIVLLAHAESKLTAVVYLTLAVGLQSGTYVGYQATFVDLAPNFSGAMYSLSTFVAYFIGMLGPTVVGFMVTEKGSPEQWRMVFYLCASLLVVGNAVDIVFGSSETQYWNWPDRYKNKHEYEESKKKGLHQQDSSQARRYSLHGAEFMD